MRKHAWFGCPLAIYLACAGAAVAHAQAVTWNVPSSVGPQDKSAILEIAKRLGIDTPTSVSLFRHSRDCLFVNVRSERVVGNRVVSTIVGVRQRSGPSCAPVRDRRVERQGNWIAFIGPSNPRPEERWRIRDGSWYIDVYLLNARSSQLGPTIGAPPDVPYDDAVAIVRAIRRRQFIDRRTDNPARPITHIDANLIQTIRQRYGSGKTVIAGEYEVTAGLGGSGDWLTVRVQNGVVELLIQGHWQE